MHHLQTFLSFPLFFQCITTDPRRAAIALYGGQTISCAFSVSEMYFYGNANDMLFSGNTRIEVISMAYVNPSIRPQFDSMPPDVREHILQMDIKLESMQDLMSCLERIVAEGEGHA